MVEAVGSNDRRELVEFSGTGYRRWITRVACPPTDRRHR
jgi:hypothetical protein